MDLTNVFNQAYVEIVRTLRAGRELLYSSCIETVQYTTTVSTVLQTIKKLYEMDHILSKTKMVYCSWLSNKRAMSNYFKRYWAHCLKTQILE